MKVEEELRILEKIFAKIFKTFPKNEWTNENTLVLKKATKEVGKIVMDDKTMEIIGKDVKKIVKGFLDKKKKRETDKIKEEDATKSVFPQILTKKEVFGGLDSNKDLFLELNKSFKAVGIKEILTKGNCTTTDTLCTEPTLFFETGVSDIPENPSSGMFNRLRTLIYNTFETDYKKEESLIIPVIKLFGKCEGEKIKPLKVGEIEIGTYFPNRNCIQLFFNPFKLKQITIMDDVLPNVFPKILSAIKALKIKKVNVDNIRMKIFIETFMKNSKKRINTLEQDNETDITKISDYERMIGNMWTTINDRYAEIDYLHSLLSTKGKGLLTELKKAKKLPFVEKIEISGSKIRVDFKEATFTIPNYARNSRMSPLKRILYLGRIYIEFSPSGFGIFNKDLGINTRPHPHASAVGGNPCFGDGEGRKKIFEMLGSNKFEELIKLLWFWIKTYRNAGAYEKTYTWYDKLLQHGFPIWDASGKRIEINDEKLKKTGEQISLSKSGDYDKNIKKYKGKKVF